MLERVQDLPFAWMFLFFWCGAMLRSNAMYWIGRAAASGTGLTRWSSVLRSPAYLRAHRWASRWGVWAVPFSFLTVGLQSLIQVSAGATRVPVARYLVATAVGALAWATIYTTIGMAVVLTWIKAGGGWALTALAVVVAMLIWVRRRQRADLANAEPEAVAADDDPQLEVAATAPRLTPHP